MRLCSSLIPLRFAVVELIDNVELWLDFLEDRNLAVHDYLGIMDEDYLKSIKKFMSEVKKLNAV